MKLEGKTTITIIGTFTAIINNSFRNNVERFLILIVFFSIISILMRK